MNSFVLDNSVCMRWIYTSNKKTDQVYAYDVLNSLINFTAIVPSLFNIEAISVLLKLVKQKDLSSIKMDKFLVMLNELPIIIDSFTAQQAYTRTVTLARKYNLSGYDASYLELAIRSDSPIATLDKDLIKAAKKCEVPIFS